MAKFKSIALAIKFCMTLRVINRKRKESLDDSFYNYLTMGLLRTLNGMMRVCCIRYEKRDPCTAQEILHWEQCHGVLLSTNMRKFYTATNGFYLRWSFDYGQGEICRVGLLNIPRLREIKVLITTTDFGEDLLVQSQAKTNIREGSSEPKENFRDIYKNEHDSEEEYGESVVQPNLCKESKIFALHSINDQALVCMIYEKCDDVFPKFFLLQLGVLKWRFLASSFIEYWRMCVAHLGLPYWELIFSSIPLPPWAEQLFLLLAPHLLIECEPRLDEIMKVNPSDKINAIDNNIFFEQSENEAGKAEKPAEMKA